MAGKDKRETAAAEQTEQQQTEQTEPVNPCKLVFGEVRFAPAKLTETVYTNDRTGGSSKKVANVSIELGHGTGWFIPGAIKAVKQTPTSKPVADFTFFGALNKGQAVKASTPEGEMELDAYREHVCQLYAAWRKERAAVTAANPTTTPAINRQAVTLDDLDF